MLFTGMSPARATLVQQDFTLAVDFAIPGNAFGLAGGDIINGFTIYDDALLTGIGVEVIAIDSNPLFQLRITVGSETFIETDDIDYGGGFPEIVFVNGNFEEFSFLADSMGSVADFNANIWLAEDFDGNFVEGFYFDTLSAPVAIAAEMPEPATLMLFGFGLAGLGFAARRRAGRRNSKLEPGAVAAG